MYLQREIWKKSQGGIMVLDLDLDPEDPGSNPYSTKELLGDLGPVNILQPNLPHRAVVRAKRRELYNQPELLGGRAV